MSGLRFARVALSVATTVVVALAFAVAVAVAGSASTKPTHFAGFPPVGVKASTPTTGRLLIGLSPTTTTGSTWNVYSDGRVIWQKWTSSGDATVVPDGARRLDTGYVQQRLTPRGVQLLLSKIPATGLFEQDLMLDVGSDHAWANHRVRRGDRMVTVIGGPLARPSGPSRLHEGNAGPDARARVDRETRSESGQMASDESVGEPADPGVRAGSLLGRFRPELARYLEAAGSSRQGARPVQASHARRVPGPDGGEGTGTPSGVRGGWAIAFGEPCVHYRLRTRQPARSLRLPPVPCPSRQRSLLARPLRDRGQGRLAPESAMAVSTPRGPHELRFPALHCGRTRTCDPRFWTVTIILEV